jgi:hypothetical protein
MSTKIFIVLALITLAAAQECPKFTCDTKNTECVKNVMDGANKTVQLTKCTEENKPFCFADVNSIFTKDTYTATCIPKITQVPPRYPGEPCDDKTTCIRSGETKGVCKDSKCEGLAVDTACTSTDDCLVGNYCKGAEGAKKCAAQEIVGNACVSTNDCVNTAVCLDSKCVAVGSIKIGEAVPTGGANDRNAACETRIVSADTCVTLKNDKTGTDNLVECKMSEDCTYTPSKGDKQTKKCQCGFNADGKGYCPYETTDATKSIWGDVVSAQNSILNNNCHTKNRGSCPEMSTSSYGSAMHKQNVRFVNPVSCANDVLSAKYIALSFFGLIAAALVL